MSEIPDFRRGAIGPVSEEFMAHTAELQRIANDRRRRTLLGILDRIATALERIAAQRRAG